MSRGKRHRWPGEIAAPTPAADAGSELRRLRAARANAERKVAGWRAQLARASGPAPGVEQAIHDARVELHELNRQIADLEAGFAIEQEE